MERHSPKKTEAVSTISKEYFEDLLNRNSCLQYKWPPLHPTAFYSLPAQHNLNTARDRKAIQQVKDKKISGADGIPAKALKQDREAQLCEHITLFPLSGRITCQGIRCCN